MAYRWRKIMEFEFLLLILARLAIGLLEITRLPCRAPIPADHSIFVLTAVGISSKTSLNSSFVFPSTFIIFYLHKVIGKYNTTDCKINQRRQKC